MVRCKELGCSSCTACAAAGESASDTSEEHRKKRPKHLDVLQYSQGLYHMVRAAAAFVTCPRMDPRAAEFMLSVPALSLIHI